MTKRPKVDSHTLLPVDKSENEQVVELCIALKEFVDKYTKKHNIKPIVAYSAIKLLDKVLTDNIVKIIKELREKQNGY